VFSLFGHIYYTAKVEENQLLHRKQMPREITYIVLSQSAKLCYIKEEDKLFDEKN